MKNLFINIINVNYIIMEEMIFEYNESMDGEKLVDIGCEYGKIKHRYHIKRCFELAINKDYLPALMCLGNYYLQIENNYLEFIKLYETAVKYKIKDAAMGLADYYNSIEDFPNMVKYLEICLEDFDDADSAWNLSQYYTGINDEKNSILYANKLITLDYNKGHFMMGQLYRHFLKYELMINHYKLFLTNIKVEDVNFENENCSELEHQLMFVIFHVFVSNEIDIEEMQNYITKFKIISSSLSGLLQFKINKTKIPYYNKTGECPICLQDNINLKLFDCLGHHYCEICTVKLDTCAMCKCSRKCRGT